MAGIGKYKKGAKFTLKSGNKPTFVQMGSSPNNLNNFGIGPGGSPYKQDNEIKVTKDKEEKKTKVVLTEEEKQHRKNQDEYLESKEGQKNIKRTKAGKKSKSQKAFDKKVKKEQQNFTGEKGEGWKKALKIARNVGKVGVTLLEGGLESVYGTKKTAPGINWEKWRKESLDKTPGETISEVTPGQKIINTEKENKIEK